MRDCSICKARAYCWEAVEPGSIMCGINLMQHGGTKSEPETPRSISVKLSPTFCAYNENANESGTITVTLMGTSSSLPYVRSLALKRKEVSVMIVDANDSASVNVAEERCRVIKPPDITRAKEIGSESVSIFVPSLNYR